MYTCLWPLRVCCEGDALNIVHISVHTFVMWLAATASSSIGLCTFILPHITSSLGAGLPAGTYQPSISQV